MSGVGPEPTDKCPCKKQTGDSQGDGHENMDTKTGDQPQPKHTKACHRCHHHPEAGTLSLGALATHPANTLILGRWPPDGERITSIV